MGESQLALVTVFLADQLMFDDVIFGWPQEQNFFLFVTAQRTSPPPPPFRRYEGRWSFDQPEGEGTLQYHDLTYSGEFRAGVRVSVPSLPPQLKGFPAHD